MSTASNLTTPHKGSTLHQDGHSPSHPINENPLARIIVRVNPIIEQWLEFALHGLPVKSSIHEFVEIAAGPHRESGQLFFLCRVGIVLSKIPRADLVEYFRWWWHWMEWNRHTAMKDVAIAHKQRQKAREHAGKAREHLDEMTTLGETDTYRRVTCQIDCEMSSNGRRRHVADTR